MEKWTYFLLLAGSILVPLIRSFESRIFFKGKWPALFAGIFVMMLIFIPWDVWFTYRNTWHFNHDFVTGVFILGLPIEEWLFFIVIPYACLFTYEVIKYFFPKISFPVSAKYLTIVFIVLFLVTAFIFASRIYTLIVTLLAASLLILQLVFVTYKKWLSHFWIMYFVSLVPFIIINGFLTALPVVIYNNTENLSLRFFTIPLEDFAYLLSMMVIVTMVYERKRKKKAV